MRVSKYLCGVTPPNRDDLDGTAKIIYTPKRNSRRPCAISPNITPNKKGKVIVVKKAGLAYL